MKILTFATLGMFAMPSYADQIGDPVTVPVTVTVSSVVLCTEAGYCGDNEMILTTEGEEE